MSIQRHVLLIFYDIRACAYVWRCSWIAILYDSYVSTVHVHIHKLRCFVLIGMTAPNGPQPLHCRGFTITLRLATLCGTPLDEWLDWMTHNTHQRQISVPPEGFEPAIPTSKWPQIHVLNRAATEWHTTLTRDRYPCPRRDSNPQFQQASGHRSIS